MTKKRTIKMIAAFGCFAILAVLTKSGATAGFDLAVQSFFLGLRSDWLSAVICSFTKIGNPESVIALMVFLLVIPYTRKSYGIPMTGAALTAVAAYQVLKRIIQRPRPDTALWLVQEHGFSYPSGHSNNSFLVWSVFILLITYYYKTRGNSLPIYKKKPEAVLFYPRTAIGLNICKTLAVLYIILMGLSRIYVGVHWPTDVIGGMLISYGLLQIAETILFGKNESSI